MAQTLLDQAEFAENPEPRCPVVLLLDTSASMEGAPIQELNDGLQELAVALREDPLASLRVEIAILTFGGQVVGLDARDGSAAVVPIDAQSLFCPVDDFHPPVLTARGDTRMGEAMRQALTLLRDRKEIYRQAGLDYFRPWIFLLTDGHPTDRGWETAAEEAQMEEARKGVLVFPVGVEGANLKTLAKFAQRPPLRLHGLAFREFFQWVSKSLTAVAQSRPGDQVALPPATWAAVDTGS